MTRAVWLAGVMLAGALGSAAAQDVKPEMTLPRITAVAVDWDAVKSELAPSNNSTPPEALARLNRAAAEKFSGVEKSSVPVLLPLDDSGKAEAAGFRQHFFQAGPTGYDAAFTLTGTAAGDIPNFDQKEEPLVLITASSIHYALDPPVAEAERPSKELEQLIPSIRRRWLESYLRYSFERYGVTYTVSMLCFDGRARKRLVACSDAANVMVRFIKALRLAGGTPQQGVAQVNTIDRPASPSPDFTFAPAGQLIPNTGFRGHGGRADSTVYARIRFPIGDAPAYANSQSFLNWGNCDFTGRTTHNWRKAAPYRCRVNDKPLVFDESAAENRSYPWRDNFCEHRLYYVGQCAGGQGHQGQDIRPSTCKLFNAGADRCTAFHDDVVAVRDGVLLRVPNRESVFLYVNVPGERLRFRYLHMHPKMLDADGVVSGRAVKEGEILGKAGNFDRIPNGTTYHLHFELQVPTRDGWVFVNPYMTLVSAYERLIGGRGRMIEEPKSTPAVGEVKEDASPVAAAAPAPAPVVVATPAPRMIMRPSRGTKAVATTVAAKVIETKPEAAKAPPPKRSAKRAHPPRRVAARQATPTPIAKQSESKPADQKVDSKPKDAAGDKTKVKAASGPCTTNPAAGSGLRVCTPRYPKAGAGTKSGVRKLGQPAPTAGAGARGI